MGLTMGSVLYDRTSKKLVYHVTFPEKEDWVIMDTVFNRIVNNKLVNRQFIPMLPSSTMFDLRFKTTLTTSD